MRTLFRLLLFSIPISAAGFYARTQHQSFLRRVPLGSPRGLESRWQQQLPRLAWLLEILRPGPLGGELELAGAVPEVSAIAPAAPSQQTVDPAARRGLYFRPVSVTVWCVMVLTMQCLVLYTALALSRNYDELSGECQPSLLTQTLTAAARGIAYPPMMCALFVACRMYVLATTGGLGEPPLWAKACMITASVGMTLQFIVVLVLPTFTEHWSAAEGEVAARFEDLAGEPNDVHVLMESQMFSSEGDRATFQALQALAVAFIYVGVAGVVAAIFTYPEGVTRVSAAVVGTAVLAVLYFSVYLLQWLGPVMGHDGATPRGLPPREGVRAAARQALLPVRKAPMVAMLFLASGIRDLHLDPPRGMPPRHEQLCIYVALGALVLEVLAALAIGATGDEETGYLGVYHFKSHRAAHISMHLFALVAYGSLVPVVRGIYVIEQYGDGWNPPPLSSVAHAVLQLVGLYFLVSVVQFSVFLARDLRDADVGHWMPAVIAAENSVRLCPLMGVLFIACRMRALQITERWGSPPTWAQQAMFMSVFAMAVHTASCLLIPLALGKASPVDGDGMAQWDVSPLIVAYSMSVLKYIALFCLHGGVIMVCIAIFTMTPETAHSAQEGLMSRDTLRYCWLVTLLGVVFGLCVSCAKVLGIIFKLAVESIDRRLLGLEICVRMAAFSICRGWMNIVDVVVSNPDFPVEGGSATWSSPHLLKVKRVCIDIDLLTLARSGGKVFEFQEVVLQGIDVNYDKPWKLRDNVNCVLEHIKSVVNMPEQPEKKASAAPDLQVIFHKVKLQDITAQVFVSGPAGLGGQMNVALADLEFPDFAQQLSNPDDPYHVQNEFVMFVVRTLMQTVASNIGPGKALKGVWRGCADAAVDCIPCG